MAIELQSRGLYRGGTARLDLTLVGDIFQANIAQRFSARLPSSFDPLTFYCRLTSWNLTSFTALLRYGKLTIASSSPERFLNLKRRRVETRPIKGTIARCADSKEDQRRAEFSPRPKWTMPRTL